jgi:hypothetical protein
MERLTQKWDLDLLVIGIFFVMGRGGMGWVLGARHGDAVDSGQHGDQSNITKDPGSGQSVDQASAVTSSKMRTMGTRAARNRIGDPGVWSRSHSLGAGELV